MGHPGGWRRAMPMFQPWWKPDHIAGADLLDRAAFALNPANPRSYQQRLAKRMGMPSGAGARLEGHPRSGDARGVRRLKQRVYPDRSGKIFGFSLREGCAPARMISMTNSFAVFELPISTLTPVAGILDCR
jgi:hypothetical protein